MPRVRCPYCGAEYTVPEGVGYAVCPYCGTTVRIDTGERVEQQYYPPRLSEQDAYAAALSRASQMPGAPRGLAQEAAFARAGLHMVPLYVCRATAWAVEEGCETAREEAEKPLLAARGEALPGLPEDYPFPATGRMPYKPGVLERVETFHQAERPPGPLCERLAEQAARRASREAVLAGCSGAVEKSYRLLAVAHYPFWLIEYSHPLANAPMKAVVDAVDATVVYVEYPIPGARRAVLLATAAGGYAAGLAAGTLLALLLHQPLLAAGAAVAALGAAAPGLRRAVARLGQYRLSASPVPPAEVRLSEKRQA